MMKSQNRGSGIVEIIVGLAVIVLGIFSLLKTYNYYLKFALSHRYDVQTALLAEEGIEAVRFLRDFSWTTKIAPLTPNTSYRLAFVNSIWTSTTSPKYIDAKFDRIFVLSDVYRDSSDVIASSGTLDPNTKKVIVSVSVRGVFGTTTRSISAYITNLFSN